MAGLRRAFFIFAGAFTAGQVHLHAVKVAQGGNITHIFIDMIPFVPLALFSMGGFGNGALANVFKSVYCHLTNHPRTAWIYFICNILRKQARGHQQTQPQHPMIKMLHPSLPHLKKARTRISSRGLTGQLQKTAQDRLFSRSFGQTAFDAIGAHISCLRFTF